MKTIPLSSLDLSSMSTGDGKVTIDANCYGDPIIAGGETFKHGIGVHALSRYDVKVVKGEAFAFSGKVALLSNYPNATAGSVIFRIRVDGKVVASTKILRYGDKAVDLTADLRGAHEIGFELNDAGDGVANDFGAWIDCVIEVSDDAVVEPLLPDQNVQLGILTPPAPDYPVINPPRIFGVRPGHPILFTLPVSGCRPMRFSVAGLPEGASFDTEKGRLSGSVAARGEYNLVFTAENEFGKDEREFKLVVGDKIALTPPMGWNSWNCFASAVSENDIRNAADAFARSGLMDYGWSYINIDDYWQNHQGDTPSAQDILGDFRNSDGSVCVNNRFRDMKGLADYIHSLGLKAGIYSSPGPSTCGKCAGSWMYEAKDAAQYAEWGFDYLKYDWCSYGNVAPGLGLKKAMAPYLLMGRELERQNRDIVFSLCQYGMDNVSTWGALTGGQCWRTTDDIRDSWPSVMSIAGRQEGLEHFAGPGAWNDADMLVVGYVGWGPKLHPTNLTHNEQYTHITIWALTASPLLIGCDLTKLDDFTLALLTNPEVLEVNQDPLGKAASRIYCDGWYQGAWARPLSDGSIALALINISPVVRKISLDLEKELGIVGKWKVRDLWKREDEGYAEGTFEAELLVHAPKFVKLTPAEGAGYAEGVTDCRERSWRRLFDGRTAVKSADCNCQ